MSATLFPDVVVNGEQIPHHQIAEEAQRHSAPKGKPGLAWRKASAALAVRALLLQEAQRREIAVAPRQLGPDLFETEEEATIRALLDDALSPARPTEEDVKAHWALNPNGYRSPPVWDVSHILFACDPSDEAAVSSARMRAELVCRRLADAPNAFASIAESESDCASKKAKGSLGQIGPGNTVPEFEKAVRSLETGEISSHPIQTRFGWHVIRLDAKADGDVLPFEIVQDKIAAAMEKEAWARAAKDFVVQLATKSTVSGADLLQRELVS